MDGMKAPTLLDFSPDTRRQHTITVGEGHLGDGGGGGGGVCGIFPRGDIHQGQGDVELQRGFEDGLDDVGKRFAFTTLTGPGANQPEIVHVSINSGGRKSLRISQ